MDVVEVAVTPTPAVIEVIVTGPQGIAGPAGPGASGYRHVQSAPAAVWTVNHQLGYRPGGVFAVDSAGTEMKGRIAHVDENTLTISFFASGTPAASGGEADIS